MKGRKFAEYVSLAISLVVMLSVIGYLAYDAIHGENDPYVSLTGEFKWKDKKIIKDQFIVPVKLINHSTRAVTKARFEILGDVGPASAEMNVEYLAGKSSTTVYRIFSKDPEALGLSVQPIEYEIE